MAAADYRLMTEATGQRIAAALEALSGTGAAAAAARANLDVYSTGETDELIAQSTAITDVSSSITASSTYVDTTATVEKRAYRQGNVVMFHFTFKAAAQSASGQAIFTGLPKAYGNTMQFTAMNTTSHAPVEFAVTTSGTLAYWYSNTGFATGDQIRGSVTYICQ